MKAHDNPQNNFSRYIIHGKAIKHDKAYMVLIRIDRILIDSYKSNLMNSITLVHGFLLSTFYVSSEK